MVFDVSNICPFYRYRYYTPERMTKKPFDVLVTYNKLNFSR